MKRTAIFPSVILIVIASLAVSAFGEGISIGSKLEDFSLKDPRGTEHSISDLKGEKGTLIVFLSAQCPVVEMYNGRINELATAYKEKGISFVGIYPNATECLNWVKHHSGKEYRFTTLVDEGNVIADRFGAQYTPEVYFFNSDSILDYHGAIDNDRSGRNPDKLYLKTAFEEKLAGKEIGQKETKAFGCSIKRVEKASAPEASL
ncbi:MAG: redoxin domain-containing protein [Acidobacteriota bacterium]|nr:redoxin domain-containing protein [Acidobacteriota bacterium]MDH3529399.1 redoxin domain-containing protein [Acidobacteriota bacterium]